MDVHNEKYGRVQHQHTSVIDARRIHENVTSFLVQVRKIANDIKEAMVFLDKITNVAEFSANITEARREKFEDCLDIINDFVTKTAEYRLKKGPRLATQNGESV